MLAEWPKDGPTLKWQRTDIGSGYSTPAVVGNRIYVLSNEGAEDEFVQALDAKDGERLWRTHLGKSGNPDQKPTYVGSRSTPTVDGNVLFALGSDGDLACVETGLGTVRWQKNLRTEFGGKPGIWAYSESPLIDGDALICSPGGSDATIVALNKKTGAVLWKSAIPGGDNAAYASPTIVQAGGLKQYVQVLEQGLVGVNAKTGAFLWRYDKAVSVYKATIPSPVAKGDIIYTGGAGKGGGAVRVKNNDGKVTVEQIYFSPKLPTAIGGAVIAGDLLFGTTGKAMVCADFKSGELKWEETALGAASICVAGGRLYLHGENGEVALVEPSAEGYREKGHFTPSGQPKRLNQMEKAWAYPVVSNARLYIRDQNVLWSFDIKASR